MKYLALFLLATWVNFATANAQSDTTKPKVVAPLRQANDSTPLLTYKDFQEFNALIQELPAKYANPITNWLQQRYQLRAQEYTTKPKSKHE
jgi:hypothetical protein